MKILREVGTNFLFKILLHGQTALLSNVFAPHYTEKARVHHVIIRLQSLKLQEHLQIQNGVHHILNKSFKKMLVKQCWIIKLEFVLISTKGVLEAGVLYTQEGGFCSPEATPLTLEQEEATGPSAPWQARLISLSSISWQGLTLLHSNATAIFVLEVPLMFPYFTLRI